jgi:hypothetical protein
MTTTELACAACGIELPPNSKFCNECGAAVSADPLPQQGRHRRHPPGHQNRLLTMRGLDHGHQGSRVQILHRFEHTFDCKNASTDKSAGPVSDMIEACM